MPQRLPLHDRRPCLPVAGRGRPRGCWVVEAVGQGVEPGAARRRGGAAVAAALRECRYCVTGQPVCASPGRCRRSPAGCPRRHVTPAPLDGRTVHHLIGVSCFAEHAVVSESGRADTAAMFRRGRGDRPGARSSRASARSATSSVPAPGRLCRLRRRRRRTVRRYGRRPRRAQTRSLPRRRARPADRGGASSERPTSSTRRSRTCSPPSRERAERCRLGGRGGRAAGDAAAAL